MVQVSSVTEVHEMVKRGDLAPLQALLKSDRSLANARSLTDPRGACPLHIAAEFGRAAAARVLLDHGADVTLRDAENDATALSWAAFYGRPEVAKLLLAAGSDPSQRNRQGLTPLGCAIGGTHGKWKQFSNASVDDWSRCVELIRSFGGSE